MLQLDNVLKAVTLGSASFVTTLSLTTGAQLLITAIAPEFFESREEDSQKEKILSAVKVIGVSVAISVVASLAGAYVANLIEEIVWTEDVDLEETVIDDLTE